MIVQRRAAEDAVSVNQDSQQLRIWRVRLLHLPFSVALLIGIASLFRPPAGPFTAPIGPATRWTWTQYTIRREHWNAPSTAGSYTSPGWPALSGCWFESYYATNFTGTGGSALTVQTGHIYEVWPWRGVAQAMWMSILGLLLEILLRRGHAKTLGLCPKCGYDLRATPDRCPECGTERSTTVERR